MATAAPLTTATWTMQPQFPIHTKYTATRKSHERARRWAACHLHLAGHDAHGLVEINLTPTVTAQHHIRSRANSSTFCWQIFPIATGDSR